MIKILKYYKNYKLLLLVAVFSMLAFIISDMFWPMLSKMFIDEALGNNSVEALKTVLIGIAIMTIVRVFSGYFKEFTYDYIATKVLGDIKNDLFKHIHKMDFKFFDKQNTGELMSRIGQDAENVWDMLGFALAVFIENMIYFSVASFILFSLNWKLALITLAGMPLIAYVAIKLRQKVSKVYDKISDHAAKLNTTAQENIAGVRLVKAFAREKHETLKFLEMNKKNYELNIERTKIFGSLFSVMEFLGNVTIVLLVVFGGAFVINEQISMGVLVAFTQYVWMLIWPMRMMGLLTNIISLGTTSAKKIDKIMSYKPAISNDEGEIIEKGKIIFHDVYLKYDEDYVLKKINLEINPGETVAIMGETGSGKSSLVNLIGRFYDVSKGNILIDGNDIRSINLKNLRDNISYIFQDSFLFSETVEENIRMGNSDLTKEDLENVAKISCVEEFVEKMNEKYNTLIGERGVGLSGGQKQRMTIARALAKKSRMIVLDDATSALDMDTEYELLKNIKESNKNITTFIIAHRISAVKNADKIIYLKDGEIFEMGTHDELVEKKGEYYKIYKDQFKDFEDISLFANEVI
jgi:ATP-binding cassette subfamily B protein